MKKITILALALALTLTLTSCSLVDSILGIFKKEPAVQDDRAVTKMTDAALEVLLSQGFETVAEDAQTEPERTVEELLEMLADGVPMQDSSGADYGALPQTFSVDLSEMAALKGTTVQFSEEPWETDKTVERFDMEDFTAEMTPEEKAEWDEMMSKSEEDWEAEIAEMEAELAEMADSFGESGELPEGADTEITEIPDMDDIQKQIDEALEGLPEEYKDLFGGLGDLGGLLGGLSG